MFFALPWAPPGKTITKIGIISPNDHYNSQYGSSFLEGNQVMTILEGIMAINAYYNGQYYGIQSLSFFMNLDIFIKINTRQVFFMS